MSQCESKILFLHGLDSSRESTKFHVIAAKQKFCIDIDYRYLNFSTVARFYDDIIEKIKPEIIVGHCVGAYWALKMSLIHQIPCVIANPRLAPNFRDDYPRIDAADLDHNIPQMAYLELGDELIDMYAAQKILEDYMLIQTIEGGHHRLLQPENINPLIEHLAHQYLHK